MLHELRASKASRYQRSPKSPNVNRNNNNELLVLMNLLHNHQVHFYNLKMKGLFFVISPLDEKSGCWTWSSRFNISEESSVDI